MRAGGVFVLKQTGALALSTRAFWMRRGPHGLTGAERFADFALHFEPALAHFTQELLFLASHLEAAFEGLAMRFAGCAAGLLGGAANLTAGFFAGVAGFLTRDARLIAPVIPRSGVGTGDGADGRTHNQYYQ